jgi:hypothetical protein
MSPPPERSLAGLVARGFLVVLALLVAIPAYLALSPAWRPIALRAACALLVVAGSLRVVRAVRGSVGRPAPSLLDAPTAPSPEVEVDERFLRLRDDLIYSRRSRRYFDAVLWPRMNELAGAPLSRPPERRQLPRLGPSLYTLERLVGDVERGQ